MFRYRYTWSRMFSKICVLKSKYTRSLKFFCICMLLVKLSTQWSYWLFNWRCKKITINRTYFSLLIITSVFDIHDSENERASLWLSSTFYDARTMNLSTTYCTYSKSRKRSGHYSIPLNLLYCLWALIKRCKWKSSEKTHSFE